jgi:hypothetical protein
MRRLLRSRFLIFALLLAVGAGSVVSVVQAGQMRIDMAMAGDAQGPGDNACSACSTGDGDAKAPVSCASACHLAAIDTVDAAKASDVIDVREFHAVGPQAMRPTMPIPDPSPPKPILG